MARRSGRSPRGVLHAVAIPMEEGPTPLGTLLVGFSLDRNAAERFKAGTNSDIAFAVGTRIVASTLDGRSAADLASAATQAGIFEKWLGDEEYIGRVQPLGASGEADEPVAIVLRSRTEHLRFLPPLRWQIAITGLAAVLVATLLGYVIARTVTRPLRALTATMREMAATGDLARTVPPNGPWDDEDARLLSATFGQLTGALDRFQREAAQRERLSSLGRLSTVIAHEIRNPLMIIKSAVRNLRRHPSAEVAETARSIDEEVTRLNRVVTDVLDFAKPISFELAPADLIEVCRDAAQAASGSAADVPVTVQTELQSAPVVTDAERLRSVLVNVLGNAQQARPGAERPASRTADSASSVEAGGRSLGDRDRRSRRRHRAGTSAAKVFEPFFTTRRTGSGLGLAIARNIIEGLGGAITIDSQVNVGTTVRIEMGGRTRMTRGSILLVDDEPKIRQALSQALDDEGHEVTATGSPRDALNVIGERPFDLLVVDNLMPELSGLDLIREVTGAGGGERPQILMMTAHATVESAIEAMKLGALDYLQKPFEIDEFLVVVGRAIEHGRLRTHHDYLITERDEQFDHYGIVGRSRAIQEVVRTAKLVAQSRSTVLITGETGTGKELVARAIHDWSAQREMPLVRVNCAALPETLIESELFGHVRGAFTGAVTNKKGRFALADGGTIFLDEIGAIAAVRAGEAAPRASGTRVRAARIGADARRGRARDRRDQSRSPPARRGWQVPGGSLLPPERHSHRHAAAARSPRGHSAAGRALHPAARRPRRQADRRHHARRDDGAGRRALAGQRPRAREHGRARRRAVAAAGDTSP